VRLKCCSDFVCRLQRVVDGPVPCGVVNHTASIPRGLLRDAIRGHPRMGIALSAAPDTWLQGGAKGTSDALASAATR
jgi:hypothetical protein